MFGCLLEDGSTGRTDGTDGTDGRTDGTDGWTTAVRSNVLHGLARVYVYYILENK